MKDAAAITGFGCVTGFGVGIECLWQGLLSGKSCAQPLSELPNAGTTYTTQSPDSKELTKHLEKAGFPPPPRATLMALLAAREAWQMADLPDDLNRERAGLIINRNFGQHALVEKYQTTLWDKGASAVSGLQFVQTIANTVLGRIAMEYKLRGVSTLFFGASALGTALDALRDNYADVILTGGLDEISDMVLFLCDQCGLTPASQRKSEVCRPFDKDRAGLLPGDAAAFLVLEKPEFAVARNAKIFGYLRGYASITDSRAVHNPAERNAPDAIYTINAALLDADIDARKISFVSSAAAGLRNFDEIEAQAIMETLPHRPPVTSCKGALGETWAAAGALSVMTALLSAQNNLLPAVAGTTKLDADCQANIVLNQPLPIHAEAMMALSFDMTGQNTAFILSKNL